MVADILTVIQSRMSKFSKGQKLIAKYILSAYDKAAFMTASKLGGVVQVSESTVVRFAVGLGYDGYPEMQKALQELIRGKLTSIQRIQVSLSLIHIEMCIRDSIPADHHHGRDAPGGDAGPGGRYPGPGEDICGRRAHQPELLR